MPVQRRDLVANLLLAAVSVGATLVALEVGARAYKGEYRWANFATERVDLLRSAYPVSFDPLLGWIPRPGTSGQDNIWGTEVTILEDGIRANGHSTIGWDHPNGGVILAVGDSFTFGDEVSDSESWPAWLERHSGRAVVNGGVFGYGVDQTYLRLEQLLPRLKPEVVIFGLIPHDIFRCGRSEHASVSKPYFTLAGAGLALNTDHIDLPPDREIDFSKRVLGYSFLASRLIPRLFPDRWLDGMVESTEVHDDGIEVACRLLRQLPDLAAEHDVSRVIVLIQYTVETTAEQQHAVYTALDCVDRQRVEVVDLRADLDSIRALDVDGYAQFVGRHMSPAGNEFVGKRLVDTLARPGLTHP